MRRLLLAVVAASAVSMFFSGPALAQSLGSLPVVGGVDPGGTVGGVTETAAPVVEQTTAPVVQTVAPVVQTVAPTVQQTTAPVVQTVTPVVQPVVQTAAPVVQPVVQTVAPVLEGGEEALGPGLDSLIGAVASPTRSAVTDTGTPGSRSVVTTPPVDVGSPTGTQPSETQPVAGVTGFAAPSVTEYLANSVDRRPEVRRIGSFGLPTVQAMELPSYSWVSRAGGTSAEARKGTTATDPRTPWPSSPRGPLVPGSVAAAFSGGGAALFAAALAAVFLLAAPGLSRRLRLALAPWPLPIALPSLERPG